MPGLRRDYTRADLRPATVSQHRPGSELPGMQGLCRDHTGTMPGLYQGRPAAGNNVTVQARSWSPWYAGPMPGLHRDYAGASNSVTAQARPSLACRDYAGTMTGLCRDYTGADLRTATRSQDKPGLELPGMPGLCRDYAGTMPGPTCGQQQGHSTGPALSSWYAGNMPGRCRGRLAADSNFTALTST